MSWSQGGRWGRPHRKLCSGTKPPPWWLPPEGSYGQQGGTSGRGQAEHREAQVGLVLGRGTCTWLQSSCVQSKGLNSTVSQDFPSPGFFGSVTAEF